MCIRDRLGTCPEQFPSGMCSGHPPAAAWRSATCSPSRTEPARRGKARRSRLQRGCFGAGTAGFRGRTQA
eukprot:4988522-Alexandrium_andersonii.AAC.1